MSLVTYRDNATAVTALKSQGGSQLAVHQNFSLISNAESSQYYPVSKKSENQRGYGMSYVTI